MNSNINIIPNLMTLIISPFAGGSGAPCACDFGGFRIT